MTNDEARKNDVNFFAKLWECVRVLASLFRCCLHVESKAAEHRRTPKAHSRESEFRHSFVIRHLALFLRHSHHALKKKIPVNTAFITSIASKACTTEAVVA